MLNHGQPCACRCGQHLVHDGVVQNRLAIITDGDSARGFERAVLWDCFPQAAARSGGNGEDAHHCTAIWGLHPACDLGGVVDRRGVGHGANTGEAARCRRRCACGDGFFVALARLAQVYVNVHQAWGDDETPGVENLRLLPRSQRVEFAGCIDGSHAARVEQQIAACVEVGCGVD